MSNLIGIAGTAKNTGKTTTLNGLLQESLGAPVRIGVTSIGYDGEDLDNITGLPKPRIVLHEGMIASTALRCVPQRGWKIIQQTGCDSALGEIVIAQCEQSSPILLAGPKTKSDLLSVTCLLTDLGCNTIFVDGALNRIAPMAVVGQIIFTTGAARNISIPFLVQETRAIEQIFSFPQHTTTIPKSRNPIVNTPADVDALLRSSVHDSVLYCSGLISFPALTVLHDALQRSKNISTVVFRDPMMLLLAEAPERTMSLIGHWKSSGIAVAYETSIALAAVTVNPFYPEYGGSVYTTKFIDHQSLLSDMKLSLTIPVFNIVPHGAAGLWRALHKK